MSQLYREFPEIRVVVRIEGFSNAVTLRDFDVASRLETGRNQALNSKKLFMSRWLICAAPSYLERRGASALPEELSQHNSLTHLVVSADQKWSTH